jgi:septal ring factor EnvC (AmiA/AmiB activator)
MSARVDEAVAELYAGDPDRFTERRRSLAAAAREQGDAAAAKQITALRKPTRSAWTLNALVRTDSGLVDQLVELGDRLREAERHLDGAAIRGLSQRRRELVDDIARTAFTVTEQQTPTAALREEVYATLLAAIADSEVADELASGRLVRAERWSGFGSGAAGAGASRADLRVVPAPAPPPPARREPTAAQRVRRERVAAAEKEVAAARRQLVKAETEAAKHHDRVQALEEQLAEARHRLTDAGHRVREAKAEVRRAEQRLGRARR